MNSPLSDTLGLQDDPRQVELLRTIIEKTKQGKLYWAKKENAITASAAGGFQINFVLWAGLMGRSRWQLLTVRDQAGNELVKVSNPSPNPMLAAVARSLLLQTADELFASVNRSAADDLDRAINAIKKL